MTNAEKTRERTEDFVREVLSVDLKQKNVSDEMVRKVATKIAKAIPQTSSRQFAANA